MTTNWSKQHLEEIERQREQFKYVNFKDIVGNSHLSLKKCGSILLDGLNDLTENLDLKSQSSNPVSEDCSLYDKKEEEKDLCGNTRVHYDNTVCNM